MSLAGHRRFRGVLGTARLAILALAALAVVGPMPALAGKPEEPPTPRVMQPGDPSGFRLPFALGTSSTVEQGWNSTFSHNGKAAFAYDFAVPLGTPIVAAADGVVSYVHSGERGCGGAEGKAEQVIGRPEFWPHAAR